MLVILTVQCSLRISLREKYHIRSYSGLHFPAFALNTLLRPNNYYAKRTIKAVIKYIEKESELHDVVAQGINKIYILSGGSLIHRIKWTKYDIQQNSKKVKTLFQKTGEKRLSSGVLGKKSTSGSGDRFLEKKSSYFRELYL